MMTCYLIRHSKTKGNLEKRYIGRTDESLCPEGVRLLEGCEGPEAERIYVSPMKRCIETARILYPRQEYRIKQEFRECDFGKFENHNYEELCHCTEYNQWVESGGMLAFPQGEDPLGFRRRCLDGFQQILDHCRQEGVQKIACIIHGGTIMSIMEAYGRPRGDYYDFQIGNGEGYELMVEDAAAGSGRFFSGSPAGRSQMAVPSGTPDRTSDFGNGKNYQKITARDLRR